LGILILFVVTPNVVSINSEIVEINDSYDQTHRSIINDSILDLQFIYNITENLSNIIFTAYDEENGEIAKGRAFGTKGEHKAADILYKNMTKLGLYTIKERLKPRFPGDPLTKKIEIQDYELKINNETVDCALRWTNIGPHGQPFKLNHNFSYKGLKIRREHPKPWEEVEDYVLLSQSFTPNFTFRQKTFIERLPGILKNLFNLKGIWDYLSHPHCKALIKYDFNNNTHDQNGGKPVRLTFFINGTVGKRINESIEDYTVDFYLKQRVNKTVESYNVIGQLNGTDPTKTVLVCCLYDSWWCQGTADSAIGMAIVLGIAKYFVEHNITPKYNIKFIGFSGEEYGLRGSKSYEFEHQRENIIYVINLNQLGFDQEVNERLKLEVIGNNERFLNEIWEIIKQTDYVNRTDNAADIVKKYSRTGHNSDDSTFAKKRPFRCKTVCFLKNGMWQFHHRDGMNHTEGDVLKYFNWTDVSVTGELILNVTKYLTEEKPTGEINSVVTLPQMSITNKNKLLGNYKNFNF
jgi:hypothetical protein